jgi:hypothetical protein
MNVSGSNGFDPWGVVWRQRQSAVVVLLVIEKTGSQEFLLSSTPLMPPYIPKMTWSRPKMSYPQRILFLFGSPSYSGRENAISRKNVFYDILPKHFEHL